jgi:ubiquinone/menaquinone biosynthesis C-methylase UbiE
MLVRAQQTSPVFDQVYRRRRQGAFLSAFDRQRGDFGGLLDCSAYITRAEARVHRGLLGRVIGNHEAPLILDVGCGTGGYGLWLANNLSTELIGLDFSGVAVEQATARAAAGGALWATFLQASFNKMPIRSGVATAAVSLDALYLAENPMVALREIRRVLRPGGLLIFTVFEPAAGCESPIAGRAGSWHADVRRAGFAIDARRDITRGWRAHMHRKHAKRWKNRNYLLQQLGPWVEPELEVSARMIGAYANPSFIDITERWEIIARA